MSIQTRKEKDKIYKVTKGNIEKIKAKGDYVKSSIKTGNKVGDNCKVDKSYSVSNTNSINIAKRHYLKHNIKTGYYANSLRNGEGTIVSPQIKTAKSHYVKKNILAVNKKMDNQNHVEMDEKTGEGIDPIKTRKSPSNIGNRIVSTNYSTKNMIKTRHRLNKGILLRGSVDSTFKKLKNDRGDNTDTGMDSLYTARDKGIAITKIGMDAIYNVRNKGIAITKMAGTTIKTGKKLYNLKRNIPNTITEITDKVKAFRLSSVSKNVHKNIFKNNEKKGHSSIRETAWGALNSSDGTTDTSSKAIYDAREYVEKGKEVFRGTKEIIKGNKSKKVKFNSQLRRQKDTIKTATRVVGNKVSSPAKIRTIKNSKIAGDLFLKKKENKAKLQASKKAYKAIQQITSSVTNTVSKFIVSNPSISGAIAVIAVLLIIFSNTGSDIVSGAMPLNFIMANEETVINYKGEIERLDEEFQQRINYYRSQPGYDDIRVDYMNEEGSAFTNWQEILSILSVKYEQDLRFSNKEEKDISNLFDRFNEIKTREEVYYCSSKFCEGHLRLVIEVYTYGLEEVLPSLSFEEWQEDWVRRLVATDLSLQFPRLGLPSLNGGLTSEEIAEILSNLPEGSVGREKIIETALSLVGRVDYFWGGKSSAGWNNNWGSPTLVTAPGSPNTGKSMPYGLDCSGFVDWVYKTAGAEDLLSGGGTAYQWNQSYAIPESSLKPGDLAFKNTPATSGVNHVGIYIGTDGSGNKLFVHCASGEGVVVNSYKGFKYWRRPFVNLGD